MAQLLLMLASNVNAIGIPNGKFLFRDAAQNYYCKIDSGGVFGCTNQNTASLVGCGTSPGITGNNMDFQISDGTSYGGSCQVTPTNNYESANVVCVGIETSTGSLILGVMSQSGTSKLVGGFSNSLMNMKCANIFTSDPQKIGGFQMRDVGNVTRAWVSTTTMLNVDENLDASGPSVSGCGSGASIIGSNRVMRLSMGSSGSAQPCSIVFASPKWTTAPLCMIRDESNAIVSTGPATTTGLAISNIPIKDTVDIICEDNGSAPDANIFSVKGPDNVDYAYLDADYVWHNRPTASPTLTGCVAGGGSPSVSGTDARFSLNVAKGPPTSCTISFGHTWDFKPNCLWRNELTQTTSSGTWNTTSITLSKFGGAGDIVDVFCDPYNEP